MSRALSLVRGGVILAAQAAAVLLWLWLGYVALCLF